MEAENFLYEWQRMCKAIKFCSNCDAKGLCSSFMVRDEEGEIPKLVTIVTSWSEKHPQKTFLSDLHEKYPNFADLFEEAYPRSAPWTFGYCGPKVNGNPPCINCKRRHYSYSCWNLPLKENK